MVVRCLAAATNKKKSLLLWVFWVTSLHCFESYMSKRLVYSAFWLKFFIFFCISYWIIVVVVVVVFWLVDDFFQLDSREDIKWTKTKLNSQECCKSGFIGKESVKVKKCIRVLYFWLIFYFILFLIVVIWFLLFLLSSRLDWAMQSGAIKKWVELVISDWSCRIILEFIQSIRCGCVFEPLSDRMELCAKRERVRLQHI